MSKPEELSDQSVGWGPVAAIGIGLLAYLGSQIIVGMLVALAAEVFGFSTDTVWGVNASNLVTLLMSALLAGAMLSILWLYIRGRGGWRALGVRSIPLKQYGWLIPAIVIYFLVLLSALALIQAFLPGIDLEQEQSVGFDSAKSTLELVAAGLALVVIAPISEELLFRGFVFRGLSNKFSWPIAAIISSGLFGLAHLQLNVGIDTFVLGMVACWLVVQTKSVLPAIILHVIKNAVAFTVVFILEL